jgi:hypothetical protein
MSIICCVLAAAAGVSFLDSIFLPGTTVEIIVVMVVPVLSMIVIMEVGPVVVMVVTSVDIPAVGGTAVGMVVSVLVGVSGIGPVVSSATRPCSSPILLESSLLWYLVVCFVRAIGWISVGVVVVVLLGAVASLFVGGNEFNWACTQSWKSTLNDLVGDTGYGVQNVWERMKYAMYRRFRCPSHCGFYPYLQRSAKSPPISFKSRYIWSRMMMLEFVTV